MNKLIFGLYVVLLLCGLSFHEFWSDELRPWLIARDTPLNDWLIVTSQEAHPVGWYVIVRFMQLIGLSFTSLKGLTFIISTFAGALLIFRSPFNRLEKILLCTNVFLFYQYSVFSRSYSLLLLFLFIACWQISDKNQSRWKLSFSLIGLSLSHFFGIILAGSLSLIQLITKRDWRSQLPVLLCCGLWLLILAMGGSTVASFPHADEMTFQRVIRTCSFFFQSLYMLPPSMNHTWGGSLLAGTFQFDYLFALLFIAVMAVLVHSMIRTRKALLFLSMTSVFLLVTYYFNRYSTFNLNHLGQFTLVLVCAYWLYLSERESENKISSGIYYSIFVVQTLTGLFFLIQDVRLPYSMSEEVGRYLKQQGTVNIIPDIPYFSASYIARTDLKFPGVENEPVSYRPSSTKDWMSINLPPKLELYPYMGSSLTSKDSYLVELFQKDFCQSEEKNLFITNYAVTGHVVSLLCLKKERDFTGALNPFEDYYVWSFTKDCSICH